MSHKTKNNKTPFVPVTDIEIREDSVFSYGGGYGHRLSKNEMVQLTAEVFPENATNKRVTWSTSDASVVTVSSAGLVTAVSTDGVAFITATTPDGCRRAHSFTVRGTSVGLDIAGDIPNVLDKFSFDSLSLVPQATMQLFATVRPAGAVHEPVAWSTEHASIATVSSMGLVAACKVGLARIIAETTVDGMKVAREMYVNVVDAIIKIKDASGEKVSSVYLEPNNMAQLFAEVKTANGVHKKVAWSTDNASVAKVSSTGMVTAIKPGKATITATTADECSDSMSVYVREDIRVTITQASGESTHRLRLPQNGTVQLCAEITPESAAHKKIVWSTEDASVATISKTGLVTAMKPGEVTITAAVGRVRANPTWWRDGRAAPVFIDVIYEVRTEADLRAMAQDLQGTYVLQNDIVLTREWVPVGTNKKPFEGTLDGAGYTIKNLWVNKPSQECVGLIGFSRGTIKNIGVELGPKGITGHSDVGALAGHSSGLVRGVVTSPQGGRVSGKHRVGALVGYNHQGYIIGYAAYDAMPVVLKGNSLRNFFARGCTYGVTRFTRPIPIALMSDAEHLYIDALVGGSRLSRWDIEYAIDEASGRGRSVTWRRFGGFGNTRNFIKYTTVNTGKGYAAGGLVGYVGCGDNMGYGSVMTDSYRKTKVTIGPDTTETGFEGLTFGTDEGDWTFYAGKGPTINLPKDERIFDPYRGGKQRGNF